MKKFLENSRKILRKSFRLMLVVMLVFVVQACRKAYPIPMYGMPDAPMYGAPGVETPEPEVTED